MDEESELTFDIRTYRSSDQQACRSLFIEGLIGGKIAVGDCGPDIDAIETHYLKSPENHFWVAQLSGRSDPSVVGMIGVQRYDDSTAEIRRLRVHEKYRRRGIGSALMERAVRFCNEKNYLRIILDTYMERDPAIKLFQKFQFRHGRTRRAGEKDLLYFYLDLYGKPVENE